MSCLSRQIHHLLYLGGQTIAAPALIGRVAAFFSKDNLAHFPFALVVCAYLLIFSILARYVLRNMCCRISCLRPSPFTRGRSRLTWTIIASMCATPFPRYRSAGSSSRRRQASACAALASG